MASKICKRVPSKNVYVGDLKPGTPVVDCGHVWVAGTGRKRAVVYWVERTDQGSRAVQQKLRAAAKRGRW